MGKISKKTELKVSIEDFDGRCFIKMVIRRYRFLTIFFEDCSLKLKLRLLKADLRLFLHAVLAAAYPLTLFVAEPNRDWLHCLMRNG